ncbi:MAG: element excision factor XisH family protein [Saprospiraceae bacterium]
MARDKFHQEVRNALEHEGWRITADPLYLKVGSIPIHIDLGAERLIGAEKDGEQIAVEIKTFGRTSFITAFHEAVGKYIVYREALSQTKSNRTLFLAMPADVYSEFSTEQLVQQVFEKYEFKILLYEPDQQSISSWIK